MDSTNAGTRPRVVIIGAGFAGLYAAKALRRAPVDIVMIDRNNYHTFQPLLYQVATAQVEAGDIAMAARGIFQRQKNFDFRMGTVTGVDWDAHLVLLENDDRVAFDYLILGAGAVYTDFGVPGVFQHGFFLKSLSEAVNIRSHLLRQFERACTDPAAIAEGALNFVIVGGGPTGVEMAGAMVELIDHVLPKDFPSLEVSQAHIIIVEMLDRLMAPYSQKNRAYTERVLRRRGVDVRLEQAVADVRVGGVELKSGEIIPTQTLIWAAGVRGNPLAEALGVELTRGWRVKQEPDLSIPGHPNAFVAGDLAGATDDDGKPYPQVAQVAIQQGKHAAKQIQRHIQGQPMQPFHYFDKGIMAIIGRNAGIAELSKSLGGFKFRGFLGWLSWLFIHLIYLVGFKNRLSVLFNWTYSYLTYDRSPRLITPMNTAEQAVAAPQAPKPETKREAERQTA
ncbi:MAG TPA: NAD(P)/FAD-dependent oxidoreductase [Trueperaceae bacterium]